MTPSALADHRNIFRLPASAAGYRLATITVGMLSTVTSRAEAAHAALSRVSTPARPSAF